MMMRQSAEFIKTSYDAVAPQYAERFDGELEHKPLDRELLTRFASEVQGQGQVYDLGCGHGETTGFLQRLGIEVRGLDLSPKLLAEAARRRPGVEFEQGDILSLPCSDESLAGAIAFYAIVHFSADDLRDALTEIHRVLKPGGRLLLAFHIGDGTTRVDAFLGCPVTIDFSFFSPSFAAEALTATGFADIEIIERDPYPGVEHPSRRAYVFASRPRRREWDSGPRSPQSQPQLPASI